MLDGSARIGVRNDISRPDGSLVGSNVRGVCGNRKQQPTQQSACSQQKAGALRDASGEPAMVDRCGHSQPRIQSAKRCRIAVAGRVSIEGEGRELNIGQLAKVCRCDTVDCGSAAPTSRMPG